MPYPWFSIGAFQFTRRESIIFGTDTLWKPTPSRSQKRPLGSSRDSIITMAVGSLSRSFEVMLEQARFDQLTSYIGTINVFTGDERPIPDSRNVYINNVEPVGQASQMCVAGETHIVRRARISLLSQA